MVSGVAVDVCGECGFSLGSEEHQKGVGLHGHTSTSTQVADEQRAKVMARAYAFAANAARDEVLATIAAMGEDALLDIAVALEARGITSKPQPLPRSAAKSKGT